MRAEMNILGLQLASRCLSSRSSLEIFADVSLLRRGHLSSGILCPLRSFIRSHPFMLALLVSSSLLALEPLEPGLMVPSKASLAPGRW